MKQDSWPRRVWANSRASDSALMALVVLAEHADSLGLTAPAVSTIAAFAKVTDRQIQRDLKKLVALGELVLINKGGGRNNPSQYQITLTSTSPFHKSKRVTLTKGVYAPKNGHSHKTPFTERNGDIHVTRSILPATRHPNIRSVNGEKAKHH